MKRKAKIKIGRPIRVKHIVTGETYEGVVKPQEGDMAVSNSQVVIEQIDGTDKIINIIDFIIEAIPKLVWIWMQIKEIFKKKD